jgi:hypothetical protein
MSTTSRAAPSSKLRRKGLLRSCYFRNVEALEAKNAGLKVVTLIATLNPVSQVLW